VIEHTYSNDVLSISVRVVPRASKTEVVGEFDSALRVKLAAPPVDGAANDELVQILAKTFKVARGSVEIVRGSNSRSKQVKVAGPDPTVLKKFGIL
jgi:TIGR00251 family protein